MSIHLVTHPLCNEADWWRVRELLIQAYPLTPTGFNWEVRRWDGNRFHRDTLNFEWARQVQLWETEAGVLVGVAHPDYPGNVSLQLHPDYRHQIEAAMFAWAEANLATSTGHETQVFEYDTPRQRLLEKRGYVKTSDGGVTRRLRFGNRVLPQPEFTEGYVIRSTTPADAQGIADILNAAFHRDFHNRQELLNFMTLSPSFRHDLDLVAQAPDGSIAAYISLTYEPTNHYAILEPVCTHPNHQRKGLARGLILEGLQRIRAMGATDVYVDTGIGMAANFLYEACGFDEAYTGYVWRLETLSDLLH